MIQLKTEQEINLKAYYVRKNTEADHLHYVRLKIHAEFPDNDNQLMCVDESVISDILEKIN